MIKEREKGKRDCGGWRGDYFKYIFLKGGDYSREAINQGKAIIRGNAVIFDRVSPHYIFALTQIIDFFVR